MAKAAEQPGVARATNGVNGAQETELTLAPEAAALPEPQRVPGQVTLAQVRADHTVQVALEYANTVLGVMGYTEHGLRHGGMTAHMAQQVLTDLGYPPREVELAGIAGFLHDVGNVVNRHEHAHIGALMAWTI